MLIPLAFALLAVWALSITLLFVFTLTAERKDRVAARLLAHQSAASLRAEVQALTEAIVRASGSGATYISPLTRNQAANGKPTEKWFEKAAHEGKVVVSGGIK